MGFYFNHFQPTTLQSTNIEPWIKSPCLCNFFVRSEMIRNPQTNWPPWFNHQMVISRPPWLSSWMGYPTNGGSFKGGESHENLENPMNIWKLLLKWMTMDGLFQGKSDLEIDDHWGYPFRKPTIIVGDWHLRTPSLSTWACSAISNLSEGWRWDMVLQLKKPVVTLKWVGLEYGS